jgi:hypothetical protein
MDIITQMAGIKLLKMLTFQYLYESRSASASPRTTSYRTLVIIEPVIANENTRGTQNVSFTTYMNVSSAGSICVTTGSVRP